MWIVGRGRRPILLGAALVCACAHHPVLPAPTTLFDTADRPVDVPAFVKHANVADYLLIGESHENECDHGWEVRLVDALTAARPFVVGLEMVSVDRQPVLDQFNAGGVGVDQLSDALDWKHEWGFSFQSYRPIFDAVRRHDAPVVALNVSREVERTVRDGGLESLSEAQRQGVTPRLIPPPPEEESMLREAMASHSGPAWARFVRVQSLWDTQMAFRAVETHQRLRRPVIVVAGGGHVEHGWGIAHRLRVFDPGAGILLVMPERPGQRPEPGEADLFFSCPESR